MGREMANDADAEIRQMGEEELASLSEKRGVILVEMQKALIPPDPHDDSNVFLEIRAGTGGDEAAAGAGRGAVERADGRGRPGQADATGRCGGPFGGQLTGM